MSAIEPGREVGMDLTRTPVRLNAAAEGVWRGHLARWFGGLNVPGRLVEELEAPADKKEKRRRSLQQEWSRFSRGEGEAVCRWLTNHGELLEHESGVSVALMEAEYRALVDPRGEEPPPPPMVPRCSGPRLVDAEGVLLEEAAKWAQGHGFNLPSAATQRVGDLVRGRKLLPAGDDPVRWVFEGRDTDPVVEAALRDALVDAGLVKDRVGSAPTEPSPAASASSVPWAPPRAWGASSERSRERTITLRVAPLEPEDVAAWVGGLGDRVPQEAQERVERLLLRPWREGQVFLPDALRARPALEALALEVADGALQEVSAVACQRAWTERRRRAVAARLTSEEDRLVWEREASRFARAWLRRAGSTATPLAEDEVDRLLCVRPPPAPTAVQVAEWVGLLGREAPLDRLREALAPWAEGTELRRALVSAGALRAEQGDLVPVDPNLWRDLAAEALEASDLHPLSPHPDAHEAIVLAVGLSLDPDAFLSAALKVIAPLRGPLCESAARGIAWRGSGGSDVLVERTWAVAVWDVLHAPMEEVDPSVGLVAARYGGRLVELSRALRGRLPRLADADPHADLLTRLPTEVVEETRAWRGLPTATDPMPRPPTEGDDPLWAREGDRARATRAGATVALVHLCPWQLSPWVRPWLWDEAVDAGRVCVDHALAGDAAARQEILMPAHGWFGLRAAAEALHPLLLLTWAADAHLDGDGVQERLSRAAMSLLRPSEGDAALLRGAQQACVRLLRRLPAPDARWWLFCRADVLAWSDDEDRELLAARFGGPAWGHPPDRGVDPARAVALAEAAGEIVVLEAWLDAPRRALARLERVRSWVPLRAANRASSPDVAALLGATPARADEELPEEVRQAELALQDAWELRHHALLALDRLGSPEALRRLTLSGAGLSPRLAAAREAVWRRSLEAVLDGGCLGERRHRDAQEDERLVPREAWVALEPEITRALGHMDAYGGFPRSDAEAIAAGVAAAAGAPRMRVVLLAACAEQIWARRRRCEDALDVLDPWAEVRGPLVAREPDRLVEERLVCLLERRDPVAVDAAWALWRRWPCDGRDVAERLERAIERGDRGPDRAAAWSPEGAADPSVVPAWPWGATTPTPPTDALPRAPRTARLRAAEPWLEEALERLPHPCLQRWVVAARSEAPALWGAHAPDRGVTAVLTALRPCLTVPERASALRAHPRGFGASWAEVAEALPAWQHVRIAEEIGEPAEIARAWERRRAKLHGPAVRLEVGFGPSRPWTVFDASDAAQVLSTLDLVEVSDDIGSQIAPVEALLTLRRARGELPGLTDEVIDRWLLRHAARLSAWVAADPLRRVHPCAQRLDELAVAGAPGAEAWAGGYDVGRAREERALRAESDPALVEAAFAKGGWRHMDELRRRHPHDLASVLHARLTQPGAWVPGTAGGEDRERSAWGEVLLLDPAGALQILKGVVARHPKQTASIGRWVLGALGGWPGRDRETARLREAALAWIRR